MEIIKPSTRLSDKLIQDCLVLEREIKNQLSHFYSHETWSASHFLYDLPGKWQLSRLAVNKIELCGFWIASRKGMDAHIHRVGVREDFRGRGIGNKLFDAFRKEAELMKLARITVFTSVHNPNALGFYKRNHFEIMKGRSLSQILALRKDVDFDSTSGRVTEPGGYDYFCLYRAVSLR